MNLKTIAKLLSYSSSSTDEITSFCIDSRKIEPGSLFVALKGERFDGHDFIAEAQAKGALAIICERAQAEISLPQFIVPSSLDALTLLASYHRQTLSCPVIALTGSNGKTTVKEMIAAILPKPSHATQGNLNNHLGVPLSVMQLKPEHRYAVFELGANHVGEIAHTVAIVQPQVALINNIAPAHIEGFGSIEGVAAAKGEIYQGMTTAGTAVINDDDVYAHFWDKSLTSKKILRFSLTKPVDIYSQAILFNQAECASFTLVTPAGKMKIDLQVPGEHNVRNALAAATCCFALGIPLSLIGKGLTEFQGVTGRLTFRTGKQNATIIDDTYNANLRSVLTAIEVLVKRNGQRILVLGDMGELGQWAQTHHEEIGQVALQKGVDKLLTYGKISEFSSKAFGGLGHHYVSQEELVKDLLPNLNKNTTVLVKGSRSATMEKIVHQLVD